MAQIVGGFLLPHDPMILQAPDAAPPDERDAVHAAFAGIRERVATLQADTAIIIGADHYILFGPGCLPSFLIATGDLSGPLERMPGLPKAAVPDHAVLARHIRDEGAAAGFDWAVAQTLTLDHSIMIPRHLCLAEAVRTIPVYLASGVAPFIGKRRAYDLGLSIGEAVRRYPGDDRVVVFGSGGISHWVGMADMGRVNPAFDRRILDWVEAGDVDALAGLADADILEQGGNGALEIRNFLCALGVMGAGATGRTLAYVPSPAWITGLGFSELFSAAPPQGTPS